MFNKTQVLAMEESTASAGNSHPCPALKTFVDKLGSILCGCQNANKYKRLDAKLEKKMVEIRPTISRHDSFRTINSIILKFPQLREQIQNLRDVFLQYDEDHNGFLDRDELRKCLNNLQSNLTTKDFDDVFHSCDVDGNGLIQFHEFIVFLCLIFLLSRPSSSSSENITRFGTVELEATFEAVLQAFFCMDKNCDGKLNKSDMIMSLTDAPCERSPAHITKTRFSKLR
ncbi:hypothetical protein RND81_12G032100 [Saponaria officinalis]|uniref:EF-hand domain-containing protein n=1 Tax=Saponaria officinalis TaxID=3572 RepID=A0AAW1H732_SAPOF